MTPTVVLMGNPNTGKSTLFNALTGASVQVSNFVGTTVDRAVATWQLDGVGAVQLVDVPGTYSLIARSPDECIAMYSLVGRESLLMPDCVVVIVDAARLLRNLYLVLQILELELPVVVALNMVDEAKAGGLAPNLEALQAELGVPVVAIDARQRRGLSDLAAAVRGQLVAPTPSAAVHPWPAWLHDALQVIAETVPDSWVRARSGRRLGVAAWMLLTGEQDGRKVAPGLSWDTVARIRASELGAGRDVDGEIIAARYAWLDAREAAFIGDAVAHDAGLAATVDRWVLHPVLGLPLFFGVMGAVFLALFSGSDPMIALIESAFGALGGHAHDAITALSPHAAVGLFADFVEQGIFGGVGAVVVFLPQIALLFLFLTLLEDSGYLARVAHLVDRILRAAGLPGQAFVPLLSGFACAVPAILSTRSMPRARDRLLTMMVLPLTSCSARLPVYTLLIAAIFPSTLGATGVPLRPLALFVMYLLSTVVTVGAAVVLGRLVVPGVTTSAFIELPPWRVPDLRVVVRTVLRRCGEFLREAGGIIAVATVVMWVLLTFPRFTPEELLDPAVFQAVTAEEAERIAAPLALERTTGAQIGKMIEPVIAPLGYDWRIGVGLLSAFTAREVFVSTMSMVHGIAGDGVEEDGGLPQAMRAAVRPSGEPLYTPAVGASLMVFFAFAMQCLSTLAVLRKEAGGWCWPLFITAYMMVLAWVSAFVTYRVVGWLVVA